jgi:hypothetical protein
MFVVSMGLLMGAGTMITRLETRQPVFEAQLS